MNRRRIETPCRPPRRPIFAPLVLLVLVVLAPPAAASDMPRPSAERGATGIHHSSSSPYAHSNRAAHDALRRASEHYRRLAEAGGWPAVPEGPLLVPGEPADQERLSLLAERLAAEGDLILHPRRFHRFLRSARADRSSRWQPGAPEEAGAIYDPALAEAVRRFQARHGLEVDGKVGPNTLAALNVPARARLAQIERNLARRRAVPDDLPARRIEINLPSFELVTYDRDRPSGAMRVVIGRPVSPTPLFRDRVTHVVLRPYWYVPAGITGRELVPAALEEPATLAAQGFEVRDGERWVSPTAIDWSAPPGDDRVRFRQRPGATNTLGLAKFVLAEQSLIYLHDSPEKHEFALAARALSHGCVRLERPLDLAAWLLDGAAGWTPERIRAAVVRGGERWLRLEEEVPVYVRYFTAWADEAGRVHFRDDVYKHAFRVR